MKNNGHILAIMAHPDDIEFLCAGTLIKLRQKGYTIHMATMTAGDCGSTRLPPEEISRVRLGEARSSARLLDATYQWAGEKDCFIHYHPTAIKRVVEIVRASQPFLVITHSPADYMIDHEMTAQLVRNASFCAGIPNLKTSGTESAPLLSGVPYLYYAMPIENRDSLGQPVTMDFFVDITDVLEKKEAMLKCHASQREWLLAHHGIDEYLESMKRWCAEAGQTMGMAYAEGFRQHRGHGYPQDNKLMAILEEEATPAPPVWP